MSYLANNRCCGGPRFEPLEPAKNINYIYRVAMAEGMQQLPLRKCYQDNCCPGGVCDYCFGDFCVYQGNQICMLGNPTK